MTKTKLKILESVFSAEIENRLPFQKKAKVMIELEEEGMIQPMEIVFPGRFPIRVAGWSLTHLGRMTYCATCPEPK